MNKKCKICNLIKDEEHFYWCNSRKIYRQNHCKKCVKDQSSASQKIVRASVRKFIHECKDKPCADCKESHPYYVMDFDHRDPSQKLFNVSQMQNGHAIKTVKAEIAKCDVVCANCHRERTFSSKP